MYIVEKVYREDISLSLLEIRALMYMPVFRQMHKAKLFKEGFWTIDYDPVIGQQVFSEMEFNLWDMILWIELIAFTLSLQKPFWAIWKAAQKHFI